MAFLDRALELGKKVGDATATVAKSVGIAAKEKSEQAIEIGKLRKDILVENGKINKLYENIGKHAFDIYNSSKDYTLLEPLFVQLTESMTKIEEYKVNIEGIRANSDLSDEDLEGDDFQADMNPEDGDGQEEAQAEEATDSEE